MRPSSNIFTLLLWPANVVRANGVYLLIFGAISIVWFSGWAKSVDQRLARTRVVYPPTADSVKSLSTPERRVETAGVDGDR